MSGLTSGILMRNPRVSFFQISHQFQFSIYSWIGRIIGAMLKTCENPNILGYIGGPQAIPIQELGFFHWHLHEKTHPQNQWFLGVELHVPCVACGQTLLGYLAAIKDQHGDRYRGNPVRPSRVTPLRWFTPEISDKFGMVFGGLTHCK